MMIVMKERKLSAGSVGLLLAAVKQVPREGKRSTTQWSCIYDQDAASVEVTMDMNYGKTYTFSL